MVRDFYTGLENLLLISHCSSYVGSIEMASICGTR